MNTTLDPLVSARILAHVNAGRPRAAFELVRRLGVPVDPELIGYVHLEALEQLQKNNPIKAAQYRAQYHAELAEEREVRGAFEALARGGGPVLLRDEQVAQVRADAQLAPLEKMRRLRALGAEDEAGVLLATHGNEIMAAQAKESSAHAERVQAENRVREARADRLRPVAQEIHLERARALSARVRRLEQDHNVGPGTGAHPPAFVAAVELARNEVDRSAARKLNDARTSVDAALVAEGILAPTPEPPAAA